MYIRTRLALWFALIVAALLALFTVTVFQLTRHRLLTEVERDVSQRAILLASTARRAPEPPGFRIPDLDVFTAADTSIQVLDQDGTVLESSGPLEDRRLPFEAVRSGRVSETHVGSVVLFLSGRPVLVDDRVQGYVAVARSPRTIYAALGRLRRFLYPGAAVSMVVAGLAGWILVRRAMRPLGRLASTAEEIAAAKDHARRLSTRSRRDEIGRLAATMNVMLSSLEDAYRRVEDVNETQRRFLADVSHELRTPLTVMLSSLDVLSRVGHDDPEFQANALGSIREETERMARMVNQLLMMARSVVDAETSSRPVLVVDVVTDVCRQQEQVDGGPTLDWGAIASLEGAVVQGDADYLKQLFWILVDNAQKYTHPEGAIRLDGTIENGSARVVVTDSGRGIDPADLPRIFQRFYRGSSAASTDGTGLGLAIAQRIAEQHGGRIEVDSEPGRGSRFTVVLPLYRSAATSTGASPDP